MRFSTGRICGDIDFTAGYAFIAMCRRLKDSHFSRKRKMPLPTLLLTIFHRMGTTLAMELRRFAKLSNIQEPISKPGYLKQRLKLAPEAIMALCDFHNTGLYRDEDMRTLNDFLILASD